MHDLKPITPLGKAEPLTETHGPVSLTEVTDTALASVAARLGQEAAAASLLQSVLGASAPDPARMGGEDLTAFWMGPDQWMVEAPFDTHEDLAAQLIAKSNGAVSITEQTDAWCRFDLTGDGLPDVFERLCAANTRAFEGGEAVRTAIDHLGCFVLCRTPEHISVLGPRSAAGSLHHALMTAIRSAH